MDDAGQALHVISLDPEGGRFRRFSERNRHLAPVNVFKAIRGADIPAQERIASGLITADLAAAGTVTDGTIGCAASHRALWRTIAAGPDGGLVMEDDVITHADLRGFLTANAPLLAHADVVFLGVNTDSVLATVSAQGLMSQEIMQPRFPDVAWIGAALKATSIADVKPYRLLKAFGLCCYWVSPRGAARLAETCLPLTNETTAIPFMAEPWPGSALDARMNAFLPEMTAFVVRPFLAYSPNVNSSTAG